MPVLNGVNAPSILRHEHVVRGDARGARPWCAAPAHGKARGVVTAGRPLTVLAGRPATTVVA